MGTFFFSFYITAAFIDEHNTSLETGFHNAKLLRRVGNVELGMIRF